MTGRTWLRTIAGALAATLCAFTGATGAIGAIGATGATGVGEAASAAYGGMQVTYAGTDAGGVATYDIRAPDDGPGVQHIRVLQPTHPAGNMPHNFLFVLPVQAGEQSRYGDGLRTLQRLDAQDRYDITIVEPTFGIDPWYANDPDAAERQHESFMTDELLPWVRATLARTGIEQSWLIGFSKSGLGGQDLILRHPRDFTLAASWDFPAAMSSYQEYGAADAYGNQSNFATNYRLSESFLRAHRAPFLHLNRIWIGGYSVFRQDVDGYDRRLTRAGIRHTVGPSVRAAHRWDSGWVPAALTALHQDGVRLRQHARRSGRRSSRRSAQRSAQRSARRPGPPSAQR